MNWKRIKWGWYIYQIDFNDSYYWETHDYCTNWTSGPQAHICVWHSDKLQKLCLDNCLSNAWLLALDTCDTGKLWHNLCHFFHNATIHWIPILLCAVTPLLLVAHGKAHRCEKINSETRQGVSTFDCEEIKSRMGCFEDQQICKQDSMMIFNWFTLFESLQKKGKVVKKTTTDNFHQHMCCLLGKSLCYMSTLELFSCSAIFFSLQFVEIVKRRAELGDLWRNHTHNIESVQRYRHQRDRKNSNRS